MRIAKLITTPKEKSLLYLPESKALLKVLRDGVMTTAVQLTALDKH